MAIRKRVIINVVASEWADVTSGVAIEPLLFLIYINDIDNGLISQMSKFADDSKLGINAADPEAIRNLQRDLAAIGEWSDVWQMPFNNDKCHVLYIGTVNLQLHTTSMDNYRYGLTSTLELLLLVGQYYFSSVIHFTLMKLISIVCIMHTCQTDIRSESFKETFTLFLYSSWLVLLLCFFFYKDILKMVFKCPVIRCIAYYDCYDRGAVFSLLEKEEQKKQWISFQIERIFHP